METKKEKLFLKVNVGQNKNFSLEGQKKLLSLQGIDCSGFKIFVPQYHHELLELGEQLHLCVTQGTYSKKVVHNRSNLVALKNNGYYFALLEIISDCGVWKVVQAKKCFNENLENSVQESVLLLLNASHLN